MREGGKVAAEIMRRTLGWLHPHSTTYQVNKFVASQMKSFHVEPSFKGFDGYPFSTCVSVNEEVVHGLPSARKLRPGDIVSLDLGVNHRGWHTDMCRTVVLPRRGGKNEAAESFLAVGRQALETAVAAAVPGGHLGDISAAMQAVVEKAGLQVVRDLVGHGIGRQLHEEPQVACFGRAGKGISLKEGMVLAIEVMYVGGSFKLNLGDDGWTLSTADGGLAAMFEDSVAITSTGPLVLTGG